MKAPGAPPETVNWGLSDRTTSEPKPSTSARASHSPTRAHKTHPTAVLRLARSEYPLGRRPKELDAFERAHRPTRARKHLDRPSRRTATTHQRRPAARHTDSARRSLPRPRVAARSHTETPVHSQPQLACAIGSSCRKQTALPSPNSRTSGSSASIPTNRTLLTSAARDRNGVKVAHGPVLYSDSPRRSGQRRSRIWMALL